MKRIMALFIVLLFLPSPAEARWIGEYARDYSNRLERGRVVRDSIAEAREKRAARDEKRLERLLPRKNRMHGVPRNLKRAQDYLFAPKEVLRRPLTIRMEERLRRRGIGRALRTDTELESTNAVRSAVRSDARRRGDLMFILNYAVSDFKDVSAIASTSLQEICKLTSVECAGLLDLSGTLAGENVNALPTDPEGSENDNGTGYFLMKSGNGFSVFAPKGQSGEGMTIEWQPSQ
jgi:hypothetical protein